MLLKQMSPQTLSIRERDATTFFATSHLWFLPHIGPLRIYRIRNWFGLDSDFSHHNLHYPIYPDKHLLKTGVIINTASKKVPRSPAIQLQALSNPFQLLQNFWNNHWWLVWLWACILGSILFWYIIKLDLLLDTDNSKFITTASDQLVSTQWGIFGNKTKLQTTNCSNFSEATIFLSVVSLVQEFDMLFATFIRTCESSVTTFHF